jgi:hypothetical protein
MSKRIRTVEIEGFGSVTFRSAGKLDMERVREAARRGEAAVREATPRYDP